MIDTCPLSNPRLTFFFSFSFLSPDCLSSFFLPSFFLLPLSCNSMAHPWQLRSSGGKLVAVRCRATMMLRFRRIEERGFGDPFSLSSSSLSPPLTWKTQNPEAWVRERREEEEREEEKKQERGSKKPEPRRDRERKKKEKPGERESAEKRERKKN